MVCFYAHITMTFEDVRGRAWRGSPSPSCCVRPQNNSEAWAKMNMLDWQIEEIEEFCSDPLKDIECEMNANSGCDPDYWDIPYEVGCC